jgi:hypothetical protein
MMTTKSTLNNANQDINRPAEKDQKLFGLSHIFQDIFNKDVSEVFDKLTSEINRTHDLDEVPDINLIDNFMEREAFARQYQRARILVNISHHNRLKQIQPQAFEDYFPHNIEHLYTVSICTFTIDFLEYLSTGEELKDYHFGQYRRFYDNLFMKYDRMGHDFASSNDMSDPQVVEFWIGVLNSPCMTDEDYHRSLLTRDVIQPQGLDLNVNHHIRLPSFGWFLKIKQKVSIMMLNLLLEKNLIKDLWAIFLIQLRPGSIL